MDANLFRRRSVLGVLGGGVAASIELITPRILDPACLTISFFVAGVRFQEILPGLANVGTKVGFNLADFKGKRSYIVRADGGQMLGYVPGGLVDTIQIMSPRTAFLSKVNYASVPWKRFQVTVIG